MGHNRNSTTSTHHDRTPGPARTLSSPTKTRTTLRTLLRVRSKEGRGAQQRGAAREREGTAFDAVPRERRRYYDGSYRAKTARHQNATCGGEHTTQPPHTRGGVYPGAWTGVVLWTRPLHPHVRYSPPLFQRPLVFQGPTWGPLLQTAIKIKRLGVRSSHIVNLKADVELRVVG